VAEAKFFPLLASAFERLRERPARAIFGPLVGLWIVLLLCAAVLPVGALAYLVVRGPMLAVPLCILTALIAMVYLGGRSFFTLQKLFATDASFFEAWAESGPQRSRSFTVAGLSLLIMLLGVVLLVVPGIVAFLGLCLAPSVLVLEDLGAKDTLRASWDMMQGWKLRCFLWVTAYFTTAIVFQVALNLVPLAGPVVSFLINLLVINPLWALFLLEFYRSLKAKAQEPEPLNWRGLVKALLLALVLLGAGGFLAYQQRGKLLELLMKAALSFHGSQEIVKEVQTAQGEPAVPVPVEGPFAPLAPQPPFAYAWSGVAPGAISVDVSGTVAVAGEGGVVQTFSYTMAPLLSQTCQVRPVLGLASGAGGELYALGVPPALFHPMIERLGPDLSQVYAWTVTGAGFGKPKGSPIAATVTGIWQADFQVKHAVWLYDPNGQVLKQGLWTAKDRGVVYSVSLAADQLGGLYLLADSIDYTAKPFSALRHLYYITNVPDDPSAEVSYGWDAALPVHAGDGYGLVGVSWEGVPYVADRHGLTALPGGVAAHNWPFELGVPLRGFAIDPWDVAHFLDAKGRMQRMSSVAY
jgi:hypothetical protein